jgi:parallel beta-helix repeat protein
MLFTLLTTLSMLVALAPVPAAWATVLQVANNGLDAAGCGTKTAPCRSITRAIDTAANGDTIVVGPGRYGDLDRDGVVGEANEEGPRIGGLVLIDKAVTIVSSSGAVWTIIDAAGGNPNVVRIIASGVRFGKAKKGFTLVNSGGAGVVVDGGAANVVVEGNLAIRTGAGFRVGGSGSGNLALGNVASANDAGFALGGSAGAVARSNLAVANAGNGFDIGGDGQRCEDDIAIGNEGFGFQAALYSDATLVGTLAIDNLQGLFAGNGDALAVSGLTALGNREGGVHNQGTGTLTLTASNLVSNGAKALGGRDNCGTLNENNPLTATNVFWGAFDGPGGDPADDACDLGTVETLVDGIAAKPFKVKTKAPQF